jgi:type II secretory pathway predicted ATPase ExeA
MFLDFYKLREQPFGVTPDPRFLYLSPGHREALASLFYGIETGRGFLSLVAEPGMGKTTLLFQLLQRWKGYVHSAFLFQTQCNSRELIRYLLDDLGLKSDGTDIVRMHAELNDFLYRETKAGRRVVVFIDEAQNLSDNVLETVRLLSDFEAPDKKLLQIILAGQPELSERLAKPGLAQLRQRIAIPARLEALPVAEVVRYVHHRLRVAGHEGPELFTPEALELIAKRSRGIPRLINNICFNAMSLGCAFQKRQIDAALAREAAEELSLQVSEPKPASGQQRAVRRIDWGFPGAFVSSYNRMRSSVLGRRFVSGAAVLLAMCGFWILLGTRTHSATAQPTALSDPQTEHSSVVQEPVIPATQPSTHDMTGLSPTNVRQRRSGENSVESFAYVVQPKDTLRDLCMSMLGRYDNQVLSEIRVLNPKLKNPDALEVGQEVRLPMSVPK